MVGLKKLLVMLSVFHETHARGIGNGGALHLEKIHAANFEASNFTETSAGSNGGALWFTGCKTKIMSCNINNATATKGGALQAEGETHLHMKNTNILKSRASSMEGGVLMTSCDSKVVLNPLKGNASLHRAWLQLLESPLIDSGTIQNCEKEVNHPRINPFAAPCYAIRPVLITIL